MKRITFLAGLVLCGSLLGCSQATWMKMLVSPQDESNAKEYVELLRQGKFDQIERDFEPSSVDANFRGTLAQMAAIFPQETAESIKVVGAHRSRRDGNDTSDITLEYEFPSQWVLVSIMSFRTNGVTKIFGFRATPMADSLENIYRFTLTGKSAVQYLILALAVGSLLFSFYAFVLCIRTKMEKRKWLWLLITLVGAFRLAVNWTTAQWSFTLLGISIPCIQANHPLYGAWTVAAYLPLGGILFLNKRWNMKITGELIPTMDEPAKTVASA